MSESLRKPDRRIAKTRHALREALMALIAERGYEHITVQDITERADLARTTFYLHFSDKDDLLFQSMREVYELLIESMPHVENGVLTGRGADARDFIHVQEYADFYRVMLSEKGSMSFLTRVRDLLAESFSDTILKPSVPHQRQARAPLDLLGYVVAGIQISTIVWWLKHNQMRLSPQVMAELMESICSYGLNWALSIDDTVPTESLS
jgi:AcrR family transcriptional regulator